MSTNRIRGRSVGYNDSNCNRLTNNISSKRHTNVVVSQRCTTCTPKGYGRRRTLTSSHRGAYDSHGFRVNSRGRARPSYNSSNNGRHSYRLQSSAIRHQACNGFTSTNSGRTNHSRPDNLYGHRSSKGPMHKGVLVSTKCSLRRGRNN